MKLDAVLHIPMSEYCCGLDERHIVYRLRCARGDLQRVTLFYADTACRVNPILFTSVPMEKLLSDEGEKMRESMGERIRAFAVPDANKLIYRDVLSLIGR